MLWGIVGPNNVNYGSELGPKLEGFQSQFKLNWTLRLNWKCAGSARACRLLQFLKSLSRHTRSNLQRLASSSQCWMGQLYSATAVPAWRALISPGALLCSLNALWTSITVHSHGSRRIRNGLFTEATCVLLGEWLNFKVPSLLVSKELPREA